MNIYDVAKTMTKEEFLNNKDLTNESGCPYLCGLPETKEELLAKCQQISCKDCWKNTIEKHEIAFKSDGMKVIEELVSCLENVNSFCENTDIQCANCPLYNDNQYCLLKLNNEKPYSESFNHAIQKIKENIECLKQKVKIYSIEHKQNGKQYDFISDEDLNVGDFVVCDTIMGKTYGLVKSIKEVSGDTKHKKCWKL